MSFEYILNYFPSLIWVVIVSLLLKWTGEETPDHRILSFNLTKGSLKQGIWLYVSVFLATLLLGNMSDISSIAFSSGVISTGLACFLFATKNFCRKIYLATYVKPKKKIDKFMLALFVIPVGAALTTKIGLILEKNWVPIEFFWQFILVAFIYCAVIYKVYEDFLGKDTDWASFNNLVIAVIFGTIFFSIIFLSLIEYSPKI